MHARHLSEFVFRNLNLMVESCCKMAVRRLIGRVKQVRIGATDGSDCPPIRKPPACLLPQNSRAESDPLAAILTYPASGISRSTVKGRQ